MPAGALASILTALLEDREGRIWAGHDKGVTIFNPLDASGAITPDGLVEQ